MPTPTPPRFGKHSPTVVQSGGQSLLTHLQLQRGSWKRLPRFEDGAKWPLLHYQCRALTDGANGEAKHRASVSAQGSVRIEAGPHQKSA
jgi:hypothetical protein